MIHHEVFHRHRLRVVSVIPSFSAGGAERWQATVMRHARTVSHTALVIGGWGSRELSLDVNHIPQYHIDSKDHGPVGDMVRRAIGEKGADVIMYWGIGKPHFLRHFDIPVVHISHSASVPGDVCKAYDDYVEDIGETAGDYLCAVSKSAASTFNPYVRKRGPVAILHNGSDVERAMPSRGGIWQKAAWRLPDNARILLFVGRMSGEKEPQRVAKALNHLPDEWHVVYYGWGHMEHQLRQDCRGAYRRSSLGTDGRVLFPTPSFGPMGDVYAAADAVVIPSLTEAFPLVMIEAWHASRQVICGNFDTVSELEECYAGGQPLVKRIPIPASPQSIAEAALSIDQDIIDRAFLVSHKHLTASAMVGRIETYLYKCHRHFDRYRELGEVEFAIPYDPESNGWPKRPTSSSSSRFELAGTTEPASSRSEDTDSSTALHHETPQSAGQPQGAAQS